MANRNPSPSTRIKKGEVRNPEGARAHNQALKNLKHLTKKELADLTNLIIKGDLDQLKRIAKKEVKASVLQVMVAAVCVKVIEKGDMHSLNMLLDRIIGKVKDEVHHSGSVGGEVTGRVSVVLPSNGKEAS